MKVYFSVIGIGLGHMTRCLSIAKHLKKMGIQCVFSSYGKAADLAAEEGFKSYKSRAMMWHQNGEGFLDIDMTILKGPIYFKRMYNHFKSEHRRIEQEEPDLIVSDSRYSIIPASKGLSIPRLYITNQPKIYLPNKDNGHKRILFPWERIGNWFNYSLLSGQDKILIPDFPLPYSISGRHMRFYEAPDSFKNKTEFVGPIAPHRPNGRSRERMEAVCDKFGVTPGEFIYIAFSGPGKIKSEIRDAIFDLFPDNPRPAIMGTAKPGKFKIHRRGNLILVDGWIDERDCLLEASSMVISRAGLSTLSELIAFGKEAVVIPQANQPEQESNADGIDKLGLGKKLRPERTDKDSLIDAIRYLQNSRKTKKASMKLRKKAAEWKGEIKSAEIIADHLENGH